jgi:hypothetical protein
MLLWQSTSEFLVVPPLSFKKRKQSINEDSGLRKLIDTLAEYKSGTKRLKKKKFHSTLNFPGIKGVRGRRPNVDGDAISITYPDN